MTDHSWHTESEGVAEFRFFFESLQSEANPYEKPISKLVFTTDYYSIFYR